MTTRPRAAVGRDLRRRRQEAWYTFDPEGSDRQLAKGFGAIEALDEHDLRPGGVIPKRPRRDADVLTYVRDGTLSFESPTGGPGIIRAGEFQRMTARGGLRRRSSNASRSDRAQVFQVWLRPLGDGRAPGQEQRRFSVAERRGMLCIVASRDGRRGSLRIQQDAEVFSALLSPGQHVVHELLPGRSAWLHLVEGEATLGGVVLTTGDGLGVVASRTVSLIARAETEILLVDVSGEAPHPVDGTDIAAGEMLTRRRSSVASGTSAPPPAREREPGLPLERERGTRAKKRASRPAVRRSSGT